MFKALFRVSHNHRFILKTNFSRGQTPSHPVSEVWQEMPVHWEGKEERCEVGRRICEVERRRCEVERRRCEVEKRRCEVERRRCEVERRRCEVERRRCEVLINM